MQFLVSRPRSALGFQQTRDTNVRSARRDGANGLALRRSRRSRRERNVRMALVTAHRCYVMETGRIVLTDDTSAMLKSDRIKKAYLDG
jgi:CMP-N-acetylneuraminic acid synthetase